MASNTGSVLIADFMLSQHLIYTTKFVDIRVRITMIMNAHHYIITLFHSMQIIGHDLSLLVLGHGASPACSSAITVKVTIVFCILMLKQYRLFILHGLQIIITIKQHFNRIILHEKIR